MQALEEPPPPPPNSHPPTHLPVQLPVKHVLGGRVFLPQLAVHHVSGQFRAVGLQTIPRLPDELHLFFCCCWGEG